MVYTVQARMLALGSGPGVRPNGDDSPPITRITWGVIADRLQTEAKVSISTHTDSHRQIDRAINHTRRTRQLAMEPSLQNRADSELFCQIKGSHDEGSQGGWQDKHGPVRQDIEKKCKAAAADGEPQWVGAGTMVRLDLTSSSRSDPAAAKYGKFHRGIPTSSSTPM